MKILILIIILLTGCGSSDFSEPEPISHKSIIPTCDLGDNYIIENEEKYGPFFSADDIETYEIEVLDDELYEDTELAIESWNTAFGYELFVFSDKPTILVQFSEMRAGGSATPPLGTGQWIINVNDSIPESSILKIITHELGHVFKLRHDLTDDRSVMSPDGGDCIPNYLIDLITEKYNL